jgi:DNA-binding NtrC family response regulator
MIERDNPEQLQVLLVGPDSALLEGLAQSFAAMGYTPRVRETLHDAREAAASRPPLLVVVDSELAEEASADALAIALAPGGALVLYHGATDVRPAVPLTLQRSVLADLTLPLERKRLLALAQHVSERVRATGRSQRRTPPEQQAF